MFMFWLFHNDAMPAYVPDHKTTGNMPAAFKNGLVAAVC